MYFCRSPIILAGKFVEMIENILDLLISHINLLDVHVPIGQETNQSEDVWKVIMNKKKWVIMPKTVLQLVRILLFIPLPIWKYNVRIHILRKMPHFQIGHQHFLFFLSIRIDIALSLPLVYYWSIVEAFAYISKPSTK